MEFISFISAGVQRVDDLGVPSSQFPGVEVTEEILTLHLSQACRTPLPLENLVTCEELNLLGTETNWLIFRLTPAQF